MPEEKRVCLFDNSKQCPALTAMEDVVRRDLGIEKVLEHACPICPIRLEMIPSAKVK